MTINKQIGIILIKGGNDMIKLPTKTSVMISLFLTYLFGAVFLALLITALPVVKYYAEVNGRNQEIIPVIVSAIYFSALPIITVLFSLYKLLSNIKKENVFCEANVSFIRLISWCSFTEALIALTAGFFYLPFLFIFIAAAFLGIILRVIKNVFEKAVEIKNENELTI